MYIIQSKSWLRRNNGKGKLDFPSLWHTAGSFLAAQTLLRHSTIDLTTNIYPHSFRGTEAVLAGTSYSINQGSSCTGNGAMRRVVDAMCRGKEWARMSLPGLIGLDAENIPALFVAVESFHFNP